MPLRSRFAPSPTGDLHLGNARTALLAWLHARSAGGVFVLRVEDIDEGRVREEYMDAQLEDLRWLGLDWDEGPDVGGEFGPYLQSRRRQMYEEATGRLVARGHVYECFCSRREIAAAASAPHGPQDEGPVYPGTCRDLAPDEAATLRSTRPSALRFRVPDRVVRFVDLLQGEQTIDAREEIGDFVIRRRDGIAAYQLAVVLDDASMQISHVVRGADLLSSTARQLLLYQALDFAPPRWLHVPLLLGPDGERLSKRHGAASLRELREAGVEADEVVAWLASTCGLATPEERLSPSSLIDRFSVGVLPREPTRPECLPWQCPAAD